MLRKIKKAIKKLPKRFIAFTIVFAMIFNYFAPITNVLALSSTTQLSVSFRNTEYEEGKVQYSLDDGKNWIDVTNNISDQAISVTVDNLRLRIVPNQNHGVDFAGIELTLCENNEQESCSQVGGLSQVGFDTSDGYSVPSNIQRVYLNQVEFNDTGNGGGSNNQDNTTTGKVSVQVAGDDLEYAAEWTDEEAYFIFGINDSPTKRILQSEVNYTTNGDDIVGYTTKEDINYEYNYNTNDVTVTFNIRTQWDLIITSLRINGELYNTPQTKSALINAYDHGSIVFNIGDVPYADKYEIEVVARKQTDEEKFLGNFAWTYDENSNEYSDDDKILNGKLEFVRAVYDNVTYNSIDDINEVGGLFEWNDGVRNTDNPTGEATLPVGTELTLKLIPDAGYQLTSFDLNGFPFEPGEEVGLYTFTIGGGNWHLGAHITETNNEVLTNSVNVRSGDINVNANYESGTAKLKVNDVVSISPNRMEEFESLANKEGYDLENYLDISLYNSIYKGGKKDANNNYESWDTPIENIEDKATITLELENDMKGRELALIHEKHNGNTITGYELIDAVYNEENNTITFETDSFSNYAIVSKEGASKVKGETYSVKDSTGNTITFKEEDGHEYQFNMIDYLSFSKEEVMNLADITSEEYDAIFDGLREATKNNGTLLSLYEIEVIDENDNLIHEGPFNIKIKMTDDMKKYNVFKLMYVKDDMSVDKPIALSVDGEYLVGTLEHLSTYVLTGDYVAPVSNPTTDVPQTTDAIYNWLTLCTISALGLSLALYGINKSQKSKTRQI